MRASLYILQHGRSVSREIDPLRPLSADGRRDIEHLAKHLAKRGVQLQHVIHSGKRRAEQTAEVISKLLAPDITPVPYSGISPDDPVEAFIGGIDMGMGTILLVSHMPFVSRLCSVMLSGEVSAQFEFTPGTLACMHFQDGAWSMAYMLCPDVI